MLRYFHLIDKKRYLEFCYNIRHILITVIFIITMTTSQMCNIAILLIFILQLKMSGITLLNWSCAHRINYVWCTTNVVDDMCGNEHYIYNSNKKTRSISLIDYVLIIKYLFSDPTNNTASCLTKNTMRRRKCKYQYINLNNSIFCSLHLFKKI